MLWDNLTAQQNEVSSANIIITGSKLYEDKFKIKELIFKLKKHYGNRLIIIGTGKVHGADKYIKKYALDFDCKYKEYNSFYTEYNVYSALTSTKYNKQYDIRHDFIRNNILLSSANKLIIFFSDNDDSIDFKHLVKSAIKLQNENKLKLICV